MTIVYTDYANGNDTTGDGSASNPWKTWSKAATGRAAGDEVREAKSPDPSALPGTLTFTDGSNTVATLLDLRSVLSVGDFIGLNIAGETWWRISGIIATEISLSFPYTGVGGTAVDGYKLNFVLLPYPGSALGSVQSFAPSGTATSHIKLSGGWDLSSETQTGVTVFKVDNATAAGQISTGAFIEYSKFIFVNFYRIYAGGRGCIFEDLQVAWTNSGMYPANVGVQILGSVIISQWATNAISTSTGMAGCTIACKCWGSNVMAMNLSYSQGKNRITSDCEVANIGNATAFALSNYITDLEFHNPTVRSAGRAWSIATNWVRRVVVYDMTTSDTASPPQIPTDPNSGCYDFDIDSPMLQVVKANGVLRDLTYWINGTTEPDTDNARNGTGKCIKYSTTPSGASVLAAEIPIGIAPVASGASKTFSVYLKSALGAGPTVSVGLFFRGQLLGSWSTPTLTAEYAQVSIGSGTMTEDAVIEMRIKVVGSGTGYLYIDDFAAA